MQFNAPVRMILDRIFKVTDCIGEFELCTPEEQQLRDLSPKRSLIMTIECLCISDQ
jgi:hypothetical protein